MVTLRSYGCVFSTIPPPTPPQTTIVLPTPSTEQSFPPPLHTHTLLHVIPCILCLVSSSQGLTILGYHDHMHVLSLTVASKAKPHWRGGRETCFCRAWLCEASYLWTSPYQMFNGNRDKEVISTKLKCGLVNCPTGHLY